MHMNSKLISYLYTKSEVHVTSISEAKVLALYITEIFLFATRISCQEINAKNWPLQPAYVCK